MHMDNILVHIMLFASRSIANPFPPGICLKTRLTCHSEEPQATRNLALPLRQTRARFLAAFTLSTQGEILRFAQDDSEGLGMTA